MWRIKLRKLMKLKGLTMKNLGDKTGLSQGMISHIMSGNRTPSLGNTSKICDVLGIKMKDLFDDNFKINNNSNKNKDNNKDNVLYLDKHINHTLKK